MESQNQKEITFKIYENPKSGRIMFEINSNLTEKSLFLGYRKECAMERIETLMDKALGQIYIKR